MKASDLPNSILPVTQTREWFTERIGKWINARSKKFFNGAMKIESASHAAYLFMVQKQLGYQFTGVGVCRECGCTEDNCSQCIQKTGQPCWWVAPDLCSACDPSLSQTKDQTIVH